MKIKHDVIPEIGRMSALCKKVSEKSINEKSFEDVNYCTSDFFILMHNNRISRILAVKENVKPFDLV